MIELNSKLLILSHYNSEHIAYSGNVPITHQLSLTRNIIIHINIG